VKTCTYRIPFGAAYFTCGGDHTTEQHNAHVNAAYVDGLRFAADIVHKEARWQMERSMRSMQRVGKALALGISERMTVTENAIRAVIETVSPRKDDT
jgi:hypothetical protein